jgi:hypothetical protein
MIGLESTKNLERWKSPDLENALEIPDFYLER